MTAHSFADSDQIAPGIKASVCVPDGRKHFLYRQRGIVIQTPEIAGLRPVRAVQSEQTWLFRRAALKRQQLKWNGQTEGEWRCSTDEQYEIIQQ